MVRFILPYLLGAGKSSLHRTKSETQKDHLIVKTTERKKQCVTFKTCSRFSVDVTSVFFRNAARSTSKTSFLRAYVKQSVWRASSWKGAPTTTSSTRRCSSKNNVVTYDLFIRKIHSWRDIVLVRHLLFIAERQPRYNKNLIQIIQYWCKGEKTSWWISLLLFNFIFHQLLITYNSITNFYPAYSTPLRLPSWLCHAFLQERIQKSSPRARKKTCAILGGRAQKDVFPFTQEKNGGRVQKIEKKWWFSTY